MLAHLLVLFVTLTACLLPSGTLPISRDRKEVRASAPVAAVAAVQAEPEGAAAKPTARTFWLASEPLRAGALVGPSRWRCEPSSERIAEASVVQGAVDGRAQVRRHRVGAHVPRMGDADDPPLA